MKEIIVGFVLLFCAFGGAYGCIKADFPTLAPGQGSERLMSGFAIAVVGGLGLAAIAKGLKVEI